MPVWSVWYIRSGLNVELSSWPWLRFSLNHLTCESQFPAHAEILQTPWATESIRSIFPDLFSPDDWSNRDIPIPVEQTVLGYACPKLAGAFSCCLILVRNARRGCRSFKALPRKAWIPQHDQHSLNVAPVQYYCGVLSSNLHTRLGQFVRLLLIPAPDMKVINFD